MATLSHAESQVRDLLDASENFDLTCHPTGWHDRQMVRQAFRACWSAALPLDRVVAIGSALTGEDPGTVEAQKALTALVREGVLRSRISRSRRVYEVAIE